MKKEVQVKPGAYGGWRTAGRELCCWTIRFLSPRTCPNFRQSWSSFGLSVRRAQGRSGDQLRSGSLAWAPMAPEAEVIFHLGQQKQPTIVEGRGVCLCLQEHCAGVGVLVAPGGICVASSAVQGFCELRKSSVRPPCTQLLPALMSECSSAGQQWYRLW